MNDKAKTKDQLLTEIRKLRNQLNRYKSSEHHHKLSEKALRESEERDSDVVENVHDLVQSVTQDGHFLSVNRAWRESLGYTEEDIGALTIFKILDSKCLSYFLQVFDLAMTGGTVDTIETTLVAKSGKRVIVEGSLYCKHAYGKPMSIRAIFRDITARKQLEEELQENIRAVSRTMNICKQAEEALHEKERWLTVTLKSIGDAVITTDHEGAVTFMNPAARSLTGWKHDEVLGKEIVFKTLDEDTAPLPTDPVEPTPPNDIVIHLTDPPLLITRDGTDIPIEYSNAPIKDDEGNISGLVLVLHDITERKRAEDTLREAHDELERRVKERTADFAEAVEKLRILKEAVETMRIGVTITDTAGRILYTNPADARMHGYSVEELISKDVRIFAPPERRNPMTLEQAEEMKGRVRESINIRKDKSVFPVWLMSSVMKDTAGKTSVIVTTCEDITERKHVEKTLAEERNLLRTLIDSLPDYISVKDLDGRFLMNNMAHVSFLGAATPEELIGKTIFDVFPKEFATQDDANDQHVLRTDRPLIEHEHVIIDQTGSKRLHVTTKMPLRNGQGDIVGLMSISRDITTRQQVEERLRLLGRALETMQLGVTIADLDGKILYTNWAEATMHGYQIEELLGNDVGIFAPSELRKPLTLGQIKDWKGLRRESVNIRKDRTTFPVWLMSEIIKDAQGKPYAIVTSCEDITERKAIEKERGQYQERLEELIRERTAEN